MGKGVSKNQVISGLFWRTAERVGAQGVNFVVSIILARLLVPEDYGVIALISVFINISYVFISAGIGTALVQKKDADNIDFSTVFYFNVAMSIICYLIIFITAPFVANFYNQEVITPVLRVLAMTIVLGGINGIQEAHVSKTMQFKKFFLATSVGTMASAVVGIVLAYKGYGVWALVAQQLTNQTIDTIILWITNNWRPLFVFSFERFKVLFKYGWKILVSSLIDAVYNDAYSLVIGKAYSSDLLGYYNKGQSFPRLLISNINNSINSVLFPALSIEQDKIDKVKMIVKRAITTSSYIIMPAMAGLGAVAPALVNILLTDKWSKCIPFVQLSCIIFSFWPIYTANLESIKALGRSDIFLKLEVIKKTIGISILFATIPFGIYVMIIAKCFSSVLSWYINASPNKKLIQYGFLEQITDLVPTIVLSVIMYVMVSLLSLLPLNNYILILVQVIVGVFIYFIGSIILKIDAYIYVKNSFVEFAKKVKVGMNR